MFGGPYLLFLDFYLFKSFVSLSFVVFIIYDHLPYVNTFLQIFLHDFKIIS